MAGVWVPWAHADLCDLGPAARVIWRRAGAITASDPAFQALSLPPAAAVVKEAAWSAPAGWVVGGLVADHREGDLAGAVGQCAGDDAAGFAACAQRVGG